MLPLVVALYTRRRVVWWAVAIGVWTLAVLVAVSRVWLGVHWTSDVVAGLALAVLGVALVERFIFPAHCGCADQRHLTRDASGPTDRGGAEVVPAQRLHEVMMSSA